MSVKSLVFPGLVMLIRTCLVVIVGQFTEMQLWCQATVKSAGVLISALGTVM